VAEEYRELDDKRVLVLIDYIGRGKMSGLDVGHLRAKGAHLFHISEGKVTKFVRYLDREIRRKLHPRPHLGAQWRGEQCA
jgi:hypothetical protein